MMKYHIKVSYSVGFLVMLWLIVMGLVVHQEPGRAISEDRPVKISENAWISAQSGELVDVIVLLEQQVDVRQANHLVDRQKRSTYVFNNLYESAETSQFAIRKWLDAKHVTYRSYYIVNALQLIADADLIAELANRLDVKRVMTNPRIALQVEKVTNSQTITSQQSVDGIEWGVQRIQAPQVWDLGFRGEGVVVAGQDTGYDWDHPALINSYQGWDGITANHDYFWHDAIHSGGGLCGPDSLVPCDDQWHGTHTMGTIVGEDGTNNIGVAPGARWIGCRNMSEGVGTPASYAECFEFFIAPYPVTGTPAEGDPTKAPDVINNSWSCPPSEGCDLDHINFLNQVVNNVRAAGIMVVSSAGNDGSACGTVHEPPAMYDATYSVGATHSDSLDAIAYFSSRGTGTGLLKPDISAPGVSVRSSVPGTGYSYAQGTSMASPHVVGAVSLLWSARPDLRGQIQSTEDIVNSTAVPRFSTQCGDPPQTVPNNVYGWGRVDAFAAVHAVISGTLSGTIREQTGEGINGVLIKAQLKPGIDWETSSDPMGLYDLQPVSGTYTVTVSKPAYITEVYTGIVVTTGQTTTLDVTLTQPCLPLEGVSFMSAPQFPQSDMEALFTGAVVTGSLPITYTWNFSDSTPIQVGNPVSHVFAVPLHAYGRTYQGVITATNACSLDVTQQWIQVHKRFSFHPLVLRKP